MGEPRSGRSSSAPSPIIANTRYSAPRCFTNASNTDHCSRQARIAERRQDVQPSPPRRAAPAHGRQRGWWLHTLVHLHAAGGIAHSVPQELMMHSSSLAACWHIASGSPAIRSGQPSVMCAAAHRRRTLQGQLACLAEPMQAGATGDAACHNLCTPAGNPALLLTDGLWSGQSGGHSGSAISSGTASSQGLHSNCTSIQAAVPRTHL